MSSPTASRSGSRRPTTSTRCIALEPDCVIYGASGPERDAGAVPDYERLLAAGINVVTTTSTTLDQPARVRYPAHRERLEAAARAGGASIYASGIEPGFLCDQLPIIFSSASRSVSKVHCYEIALYDDYGVKEIMIDALGFGQPLDFEPWIMLPGAIAGEFEGQVRYIADGLGVEVVRGPRDLRPEAHRAADRDRVRHRRARDLRRDPLPGDRRRRRPRGDRHRPHHPPRPPRRHRLADRGGRPLVPHHAGGQAELRHLGHARRWTTRRRPASRPWAAAPARCSPRRCGS